MTWRVFWFLILVSLASPTPAHAYIDPLSGSVVLQVAAAGVFGAMFTFRSWWTKVKALTRSGWQRVRGK
jgi:hypothetical protein